jgi:hypothetical protein
MKTTAKFQIALAAVFGLIVIMFFLPFFDLSGLFADLAEISSADLASWGLTSVAALSVNGFTMAFSGAAFMFLIVLVVALVNIVLPLLAAFNVLKLDGKLIFLIGLLSAIAVLVLSAFQYYPFIMGMMIGINVIGIGFWIMLGASIAAIVVAAMGRSKAKAEPADVAPPAPPAPPSETPAE